MLRTAILAFLSLVVTVAGAAAAQPQRERGAAELQVARPKHFPHRIWAACDFEAQTPDFAWFGPTQEQDIAAYPGNQTAMGVAARPYKSFSAIMTGINPVPGPRMGKQNHLYLRYKLTGATEATFQHFSLSTGDNNHIRLSGLTEGEWAEATMNFTRDGRRNDGTPGVPFAEGERMDDLKIFVGKPRDGKKYDLLVDDVIFFSNDPERPPEPEPFPRRVIYSAAFDTGINPKVKEKYWPGEFEVATNDLPDDSNWGVARAASFKKGPGKWIRLQLAPHRRVGARTKLRFRYHLRGTAKLTVQIFDVTDQDNRHIHLTDCLQGKWVTQYLDFTRDGRRNDGSDTPFAAGHMVDDIFFFVQPDDREQGVELLVDEVVLFDAAPQTKRQRNAPDGKRPSPGKRSSRPAPPKFPFDALAARKYRQEYAASAGLPLEINNRAGMTFVLIPPGEFVMGSPDDEPGHGDTPYDETQHPVRLTRPFYLSKTETTVGQFRRFVEETGHVTDGEKNGGGHAHDERAVWKHRRGTSWKKPGYAGPYKQLDEHPVVHVSYTDAVAFCRWLSRRAKGGDERKARVYKLPTEAQWEWACRAGSGGAYWWGDDVDATGKRTNAGDRSLKRVHPQWPREIMPMDDGHAFCAPVGSYRANAFGLHDMLGNVWEFCGTRYGKFPERLAIDPGDLDPKRGFTVRGGGWSNRPTDVRCAIRNADPPHFCHSNLGFRVAIELPAHRGRE